MHRLILVVPVLLAGCGGTTTPPPRATLPVPEREVRPVTWTPGTGRYRIASHIDVEQEFQGRTQETLLQLVYFGSLSVGRDTSARMRATLTVDSVLADSAGVLSAADRSRAAGAAFSATLMADGRVAMEGGADSLLAGRLRQLATGFWQAFPRIPATGVLPGQSWIDTTEAVTRSGDGDVTVRSVNNRVALQWGEVNGIRALPIRVESAYTIEGAGQQMGQPFSLNGRGTRLMVQYMAPDGRYLKGEAADSATLEIVLTQMGLTIPGTQVRADTLQLLR